MTAGEAISRNVVRAEALDRTQAHAPEIADRRATHCVVFEGEKVRGVVRLRDAATISPQRLLIDLMSPCAEVDVNTPLVEIADEFFNPEHDAFLVMDRSRYVGLLTRESLLERLLVEQKAITAEREEVAVERSNLARTLEAEVAAKTDQLARANREVELLTYSLSHNLRAPLRRILMFSEVLSEGKDDLSEESRHAVARIVASADLGIRIINSARVLAEAVHSSLELEPVRLSAVFAKIVEQYEARREARRIELLVAQSDAVVLAHFDSLYQVVSNLVENAFKFSPQNGGRVIIRVEPMGAVARVWVVDNGSGVPAQDKEAIFRAFERGSNAEGVVGAGIGLAFSRLCMRQMKGSIGVESEPNEGSRFWIELPLAIDA